MKRHNDGSSGARSRFPLWLLTLLALPASTACGEPEDARERRPAATAPAPADDAGTVVATAPTPPPGPPRVSGLNSSSQVVDVSTLGFNDGPAGAPIRVIEFSDFGCGYCRKFHIETYPALRQLYMDAGTVEWKYVTYVSGMFPNGLDAAFAGECAAEQERFEPMQMRLFEEQREWKSASDPSLLFERYAREEGLDVDRFRSCIDEGRREDRVRGGILAGARLGVRGTPAFVVDGVPLMGALPLEFFRSTIDARLEELGLPVP